MERETLERNLIELRERIGEASAKWGGARICAVTKTVDIDTINLACELGVDTIGENRVQEMMSKIDLLPAHVEKHIIGVLQTNKVKYIAGRVDMVQSLDRDALAEELSKRCAAAGRVMPVLVQVNIAREPQKSGIDEDELVAFLKRCACLDGISVRGLMAIMPVADDPEDVRPYFRRMRSWFERLRDMDLNGVSMDILSMGMSADCIVAAQEGATLVRPGRALFGERIYPNK